MSDERHGRAKIATISKDVNALRQAIRSWDAEATEAAWDRCERWLSIMFQGDSERDRLLAEMATLREVNAQQARQIAALTEDREYET